MKDYRSRWPWVIAILLSLALVVSCRPAPVGLEPEPADEGDEKYFNLPSAVTATEDLHLTGSPPDEVDIACLLYTSPSPRDRTRSRMPSSA